METVWDLSLLNRATAEPDGIHTEGERRGGGREGGKKRERTCSSKFIMVLRKCRSSYTMRNRALAGFNSHPCLNTAKKAIAYPKLSLHT